MYIYILIDSCIYPADSDSEPPSYVSNATSPHNSRLKAPLPIPATALPSPRW